MHNWFGKDEHRRQYEQFVDDALHTDEVASALAAAPTVNAEQLRTATLEAAPTVVEAAHAEYDRYNRAEQHHHRGSRQEFGASMRETGESFGWFALGTAMVVIVAGISAVVFLAVGYVLLPLGMNDTDMEHPLRVAGFVAVAISVGSAALGGLAMLTTAMRNRARPTGEREVDLAREAWRRAVLHRGILPYMRSRLLEASDEDTSLRG